MMKDLIELGADPKAKSPDGSGAVFLATGSRRRLDAVKMLVEMGLDANEAPRGRGSALHTRWSGANDVVQYRWRTTWADLPALLKTTSAGRRLRRRCSRSPKSTIELMQKLTAERQKWKRSQTRLWWWPVEAEPMDLDRARASFSRNSDSCSNWALIYCASIRRPVTLIGWEACGESEDRESALESLWFLMHHSDDPSRRTIVFNCYGDDSGTEEQSPIVLLGAILLDKHNFILLDERWRRMLRQFRLESLHIADFVRPHGRHVGMHKELKIALFAE